MTIHAPPTQDTPAAHLAVAAWYPKLPGNRQVGRSIHFLVMCAPLRLRVENQLGFKMVKWISAIEFVESVQSVGQGEGGYNEDREYFGELANI
jgi:hypothetical protein